MDSVVVAARSVLLLRPPPAYCGWTVLRWASSVPAAPPTYCGWTAPVCFSWTGFLVGFFCSRRTCIVKPKVLSSSGWRSRNFDFDGINNFSTASIILRRPRYRVLALHFDRKRLLQTISNLSSFVQLPSPSTACNMSRHTFTSSLQQISITPTVFQLSAWAILSAVVAAFEITTRVVRSQTQNFASHS